MTTVRSKVENNRNQWLGKFKRTVDRNFSLLKERPRFVKSHRLPSCILHLIKVEVKREKQIMLSFYFYVLLYWHILLTSVNIRSVCSPV